MPEKFDLLRVEYLATKGLDFETGLAFAPCYQIKEGDTVETAKGRAFVIKREGYVTKEDSLWKLIEGIIPVDRVLFKITPIKFEEEDE